jgi:hypothetical protein
LGKLQRKHFLDDGLSQTLEQQYLPYETIIMSNFLDTLTFGDQVIGYQCNNLVEGSGNSVENVELPFWFDVKFPASTTEEEAIELVRSQLLTSVSEEYGLSDGFRCEDPPLDGSPWLVRVTSNTNQYVKEDFFGTFIALCVYFYSEEDEKCFRFSSSRTKGNANAKC